MWQPGAFRSDRMKLRLFVAVLFAGAAAARGASTCHVTNPERPPAAPVGDVSQCPRAEPNECGEHCIVDISGSHVGRRDWRRILKAALERCNTTVRLWPAVDLDFTPQIIVAYDPETGRIRRTEEDLLPLYLAPCVTLTSVLDRNNPTPARTPRTPGPRLKYGPADPRRSGPARTLLWLPCVDRVRPSDHIRISGFRLEGPTTGQQSGSDVGIRIVSCTDVEIHNMEIYGWGDAGIFVDNQPGRRITSFDVVRIHDNFIHHNQHPEMGGALGYGIEVLAHAWAQIYRNVFDFNRHAITATGGSHGYVAEENLVLKGGGWHGRDPINLYVHQFDVHGTDTFCVAFWCTSGYGGQAGSEFRFHRNSFQYKSDNAIHIRGRPVLSADIAENVFPHATLEKGDLGGTDYAVRLETRTNVSPRPNNVIQTDTFGEYYSQGDFDGDGIDDLFLATGTTWWYSSSGTASWSFLNTSSKRIKDLRFGYFDDDNVCDVLTESGGPGKWLISSGGTGAWKPLEEAWLPQPLPGAWKPLKDVQFGRFDPNDVTRGRRQTTHAFYREPENGQWSVKRLSEPGSNWRLVQRSSFPMSKLRFGDFTGDGITDVLAVESGSWAYSESALTRWKPLNPSLSDPVAALFIANMDSDDDIDDILRLDVQSKPVSGCPSAEDVELVWRRSKNGKDTWREFRKYSFRWPSTSGGCYQPEPGVGYVRPKFGFVGRFGIVSGGTLTVDEKRRGHFFSPGSAPREWTSLFPY